ncbi:MAG: hypothetical protein WDN49_17805 [Acetobacteraceae bacterium]
MPAAASTRIEIAFAAGDIAVQRRGLQLAEALRGMGYAVESSTVASIRRREGRCGLFLSHRRSGCNGCLPRNRRRFRRTETCDDKQPGSTRARHCPDHDFFCHPFGRWPAWNELSPSQP